MPELSINASRLWSRLMDMAEIGEIPGNGSRRLALSQDDEDGRELFLSWCRNRGFATQFDQVGNLFIRREGADTKADPLVIGSHLDTQPNGGRFDGILGVLAGLEVLETLEDSGIVTAAPVEVAVWTNEEGSRFQPAMMGSGVHCGVHSLADTRAITDAAGVSVGSELGKHGYAKGIPVGQHRIGSYIELHIEQGPVLQNAGKVIGTVTGGQAIRWYEVSIKGEETHAGPVPMALRRDPVPVLARVIDLAHKIGLTDPASRSTIGKIETRPGSINVVPGQVSLTVDLRNPDEGTLDAMHKNWQDGIAKIDTDAGTVEVSASQIWHSPVVTFDSGLIEAVRASAEARNLPTLDLVSGAGHDAFHLARVVPSTMVFIPCLDGISHNEKEWAEPEHATAGANVLLDVVMERTRAKTAEVLA